LAQIAHQAEESAALQKTREQLGPGDWVRVARLDRPGQIVRVDARRGIAVVKSGIGQWEVPLEEVFPT
jgi:DNA mismatch repair protein MutS2